MSYIYRVSQKKLKSRFLVTKIETLPDKTAGSNLLKLFNPFYVSDIQRNMLSLGLFGCDSTLFKEGVVKFS